MKRQGNGEREEGRRREKLVCGNSHPQAALERRIQRPWRLRDKL